MARDPVPDTFESHLSHTKNVLYPDERSVDFSLG